MAVIWLQKTARTASRAPGRTQPDLHLIKQVEQVTTFFGSSAMLHVSIKTPL
jgi:hypothetical protein